MKIPVGCPRAHVTESEHRASILRASWRAILCSVTGLRAFPKPLKFMDHMFHWSPVGLSASPSVVIVTMSVFLPIDFVAPFNCLITSLLCTACTMNPKHFQLNSIHILRVLFDSRRQKFRCWNEWPRWLQIRHRHSTLAVQFTSYYVVIPIVTTRPQIAAAVTWDQRLLSWIIILYYIILLAVGLSSGINGKRNVTTHSEQMCASIALWSRCLPFK